MRALLSFNQNGQPALGLDTPPATKKKSCLGPILCVCYTNHALDQFLTDLLDAGVENLIRVGGSSRSERLDKYNLRNLPKANLGRRGFTISKELLPDLEKKIGCVQNANAGNRANQRYTSFFIRLTVCESVFFHGMSWLPMSRRPVQTSPARLFRRMTRRMDLI